jgi:hypothetical protein
MVAAAVAATPSQKFKSSKWGKMEQGRVILQDLTMLAASGYGGNVPLMVSGAKVGGGQGGSALAKISSGSCGTD